MGPNSPKVLSAWHHTSSNKVLSNVETVKQVKRAGLGLLSMHADQSTPYRRMTERHLRKQPCKAAALSERNGQASSSLISVSAGGGHTCGVFYAG